MQSGNRKCSLPLLLVFFLAGNLLALTAHGRPAERARVRRTRVRHIYWNPVFRGSRESLLKQNEEIDRLALPRIENDQQLDELIQQGDLVPLPESYTLTVASDLKPNHRYCRPWTADFLRDLSEAYYQKFHAPLQVNSAVRTVEQQRKLRRHNRNAAPETGETASSHLAGLTVDIAKRGMEREQRRWLDAYMLPLKQLGLIEPEEERRQPVFHIMVSERYDQWKQLLQTGEAASVDLEPAGR